MIKSSSSYDLGKIGKLLLILIFFGTGAVVASVLSKKGSFIALSSVLLFGVLYILLLLKSPDRYVKYTFLLPAILVLASVSIFPFFYALRASLSNVSAINLLGKWDFVGLGNYLSLFTDRVFWNALLLTVEYLVVAVVVEYLLGLGFAVLLNRLPNILLSIFLLPMMVTPIAAGLIWKSMLNIDNGFINLLLASAGVKGLPWLTYEPLPLFKMFSPLIQNLAERLNFTYGFLAIVSVDVWQWTPLMCLFLLTGLRTLPVEYFEVPQVDGASRWQILRYIALPLLRPVILVAVLIRMIDVFKVYDTIYALFGTGVGVRTLNVHLTTFVFRTHDYGEGSALSIVVLLLVSIIVPLYFNLTSRMRE